MPAVSAGISQVLSTASTVEHGQRTASCDTSLVVIEAAVLIAREDDEMFMTRSLNVTPKTTEQRIYCMQ